MTKQYHKRYHLTATKGKYPGQQYNKHCYLVAVRDNDDYDEDFTNKAKAIKCAKALKRLGHADVEIHVYKGNVEDEHAIYIDTINVNKRR